MKTKATPEKSAAAPAPAAPAFDRAVAVSVAPRRHEGTARTVGYVQTAKDEAHLYSYAGDYIATVTASEAASFLPTAPASA